MRVFFCETRTEIYQYSEYILAFKGHFQAVSFKFVTFRHELAYLGMSIEEVIYQNSCTEGNKNIKQIRQ